MLCKLIGAIASSVAVLVAAVPANAQQVRYHVRLLSPAASAAAAGINPKGDVAGFEGATGSSIEAVIFQHDQTVTHLGTLGGPTSSAHGINVYDQATGTSRIASTSFVVHAFRWAKGAMTDLGSLGTGDNAFSQGVAINKAGQVAGNTGFGVDSEHAFLWTKRVMKDLGVLPGTTASAAYAINTAGHVVGTAEGSGVQRAYLYRDGGMLDLQPNDPASFASARGLNDTDQVVGYASLASPSGAVQSQAFLWDNGVMKPLGMARSTDTTSVATAVNNLGVVVGISSSYKNPVGFVYDGTSMADLNTLVDNAADWVFTDALSINDKGQITGNGLYGGIPHPYLLTPAK